MTSPNHINVAIATLFIGLFIFIAGGFFISYLWRKKWKTRFTPDGYYIEFVPKDNESLQRTIKLFEIIKSEKKNNEITEANELRIVDCFNENEKSYFWNPTPIEIAEYNDEWFSTPVEERHFSENLITKWSILSMLDAFWKGGYDFLAIQKEGDRYYLNFYPYGYPYGGTSSMVAFLECFGHSVTGTNDGTGYENYIKRSVFWKSKK